MGNHDDEGSLSRKHTVHVMSSLPYSLTESGPPLGAINDKGDPDGGYGNYVVEVLAAKTDHSAVSLWLFDTHSYSPDKKKFKGYNWVQQSQIDWFNKEFHARRDEHAKYAYIHLDLAFIHVSPLLLLPPGNCTLQIPISYFLCSCSLNLIDLNVPK